MIPIDPGPHYGRELIYGANQPEYRPLPVRVSEDSLREITTRWQLTPDERAAIAQGADVFYRQITFGSPLQPISPWIAGLDSEEPTPQPDA